MKAEEWHVGLPLAIKILGGSPNGGGSHGGGSPKGGVLRGGVPRGVAQRGGGAVGWWGAMAGLNGGPMGGVQWGVPIRVSDGGVPLAGGGRWGSRGVMGSDRVRGV